VISRPIRADRRRLLLERLYRPRKRRNNCSAGSLILAMGMLCGAQFSGPGSLNSQTSVGTLMVHFESRKRGMHMPIDYDANEQVGFSFHPELNNSDAFVRRSNVYVDAALTD
jgi:hypothetical protein